jgi:hypothetical protein
VLAYWLKSLVKRPDEQSATKQMVEDLQLTETAKSRGFPFLKSEALDQNGLKLSYVIDAQTFKILELSKLIVPIRSQRSDAPGSSAPAQVEQQLSLPSDLAAAPSSDSLWSPESEKLVRRLINVHLPQALWTAFPNDRLLVTANGLNRLQKRPFKKQSWAQIVDVMSTTKLIPGKFYESFDRLFPSNWESEVREGQWAFYNREYLQKIRDHIQTKPVETRSAYSIEFRRKIRALITQDWDYLPHVQSHRIWTYDVKAGGHRVYRICPR